MLFMKSMFVQNLGRFALDCFLLLEIEEKTGLDNLQPSEPFEIRI